MRKLFSVLLAILLEGIACAPGYAATVDPTTLAPQPQSNISDSGTTSALRLHDIGDNSRSYPMDVRLVDSAGAYVAIGGGGGGGVAAGPTAIVVDPSTLKTPPMSFISDSGQKSAVRLHDTGDGSRLFPMDVRLVDSNGNYVNAGGGGGGGTIATITQGANILVTNPSGPNTTIATVQNPTFTGPVTAGTYVSPGLAGVGTRCLQTDNTGTVSVNSIGCSTITSLTAGSNIVAPLTGPTPTVAVTNAPTFTGLVTTGNIKNNGLAGTGTRCVQTDAVGNETATAAACGTGNGTLTSILQGSNAVITNPTGPSPTVAVTDSPNFAGVVNSAGYNSNTGGIRTGTTTTSGAGFLANYVGGMTFTDYPFAFGFTNADGPNSGNTEFGGDSTANVNGVNGRCLTFARHSGLGAPSSGPQNLVTFDCNGNVGVLSTLFASALSSVGAITGATLTTTGAISGASVAATGALTGATATTTGLGSFASERITGLGSASVLCLNGASGTNVAQSAQGCMTTYLNGTAQTGTPHIEQFNNTPTVADGGSRTYTFGLAFVTIPVCQVNQSAVGISPAVLGGAQGIYPSAISTTSVTITNRSGATQTPYVSCIGS